MGFLCVQVGVAEMKVAVERTGGLVVLAESFGHSVFKDSFKRVFEDGEQSLGLCFKLALVTTPKLLVLVQLFKFTFFFSYPWC